MQRIAKLPAKIGTGWKAVITLICLSVMTSFTKENLPSITRSLLVLIPVLVMIWIWSVKSEKKTK